MLALALPYFGLSPTDTTLCKAGLTHFALYVDTQFKGVIIARSIIASALRKEAFLPSIRPEDSWCI